MLDWFGAFFSGRDCKFEIIFEAVLADVFVETLRAKSNLDFLFLGVRFV